MFLGGVSVWRIFLSKSEFFCNFLTITLVWSRVLNLGALSDLIRLQVLIHAKLSEFCLNDIFKFLKMCICYESWLQVLFVIDIEVVLSLPLPHSFILQDPLEILFADHANDFFLCRHICLHRLLWQRVCLNSEWNLFNSNVLHTDLFLDVFYAWVAIFPFVFKRFHAIVA